MFKFSPDGKLLMTLGKPGGGREPDYFYQPNDVLVAPNGDIFVSEGHASTEGSNARVLKFDKNGKFIKSWGKLGTGPGEFDQPHALAMDSKGRLFVGDRGNNRIQIFDQDGKYLSGVVAVQPSERHRHRQERQHLRGRLGVGLGEPARTATGSAASGSAARRTGPSQGSFPTPTRTPPARARPKASPWTARATSTARKSGRGRSRVYVKKNP